MKKNAAGFAPHRQGLHIEVDLIADRWCCSQDEARMKPNSLGLLDEGKDTLRKA